MRLGLGRVQALLANLDHPERSLRGALVAGTNGKGSVVAIVASALRAAGYSTATSPSPHLHSYRERVTIEGEPITRAALEVLLEAVLAASAHAEAEHGPATEFELLTAAAYLEAARRSVDVMVMEVGLGGRLDASNAWDADVAVVTNVGLDHQEFLGHSIESVAAEKAAIIKPGSLAVTGADGSALRVVRDRATDVGVSLIECRALPVVSMTRAGLRLRDERRGTLELPLLGRHQAGNAAVALGVIEALAAARVAEVPDDAVRSGFASTRWPGRLELLERDGLTILLDGAHNPDGMATLVSTVDDLRGELPGGRCTLLLGVMRDKEVDDMLRVLAASETLVAAEVIVTDVPDTERAMPARQLADRWAAVTAGHAQAVPAADEALVQAMDLAAAAGGPLVVAGSLYLVGHLRASLVPGTISDADA